MFSSPKLTSFEKSTTKLSLTGYTTWGLLMALPPPFYPLEAERKGATPQQVISTVSIIKHFTKEYRKSLNSFFFAVWICLWNLQSDGLLDRPHLWELWNKNGPSQFVQVKLL